MKSQQYIIYNCRNTYQIDHDVVTNPLKMYFAWILALRNITNIVPRYLLSFITPLGPTHIRGFCWAEKHHAIACSVPTWLIQRNKRWVLVLPAMLIYGGIYAENCCKNHSARCEWSLNAFTARYLLMHCIDFWCTLWNVLVSVPEVCCSWQLKM